MTTAKTPKGRTVSVATRHERIGAIEAEFGLLYFGGVKVAYWASRDECWNLALALPKADEFIDSTGLASE